MKFKTAKRWFKWHKWTSLICTVFLFLLCITGLPLIFHEEIDEYLTAHKEAVIPPGTQKLNLDKLEQIAESQYPGEHARYAFWDQKDHPDQVLFDVVKSPDAGPEHSKFLILNEYTGEVLGQPKDEGFMSIVRHLHVDLFAGIPGKLFLGLMGILFVISIVTGIVLYGPIMKNFDFGMVRKDKSKRLKWLDTHNLLGIVMMAWMMVVGITGIINAMSDVIVGLWQQGQLAEMTAPYKNEKPYTGELSSLQAAVYTAEKKVPDMNVGIVAYPGTMFTSKHHYAIFMKGNTEVTSRLLMPVLIDAKTGEVTDSRKMPWYVDTLFLSQPLHFGNYGGMGLKIIWTVFDVLSIIVLITGIYLWIARRKSEKRHWKNLEKKYSHE
ncbi:peptidase [Elizabethkingia meningoseptica]|uniref:PepSY-associated TM helix domain-containing protein n=1 Tax=Elizabethkingia meningoseptica TaxID=238 RepID=UPI00099A13AC|nr:PepSY-associated TM helix domain-containing protein [Elizabethkingia meningoseptica]OPC33582.1 peptidase [Elizabethkingia meningoseptica]